MPFFTVSVTVTTEVPSHLGKDKVQDVAGEVVEHAFVFAQELKL